MFTENGFSDATDIQVAGYSDTVDGKKYIYYESYGYHFVEQYDKTGYCTCVAEFNHDDYIREYLVPIAKMKELDAADRAEKLLEIMQGKNNTSRANLEEEKKDKEVKEEKTPLEAGEEDEDSDAGGESDRSDYIYEDYRHYYDEVDGKPPTIIPYSKAI